MVRSRYTQIRAFLLLVVMSMGLLPQVVLAVAAPMAPDKVSAAAMPMPGSGHCSDCDMRSHPMAMTQGCSAAPCFAVPAIFTVGLLLEPASGSEFALSTYDV